MTKYLFSFLLVAGTSLAQYSMKPAGAPPSEIPQAFASQLQQQGVQILNATGAPELEIWLRATAPSGPKNTEDAVALPTVPHGAYLGVIRLYANGADRRGQTLKPGFYTLRYSLYPVNGDHQGVSPNRDFALLTPLAEDKDPAATPDSDTLCGMSRKATGTPHPAVLSIWNSSADKFPAFSKQGDRDWVLDTKLGDLPVSLLLLGKLEA